MPRQALNISENATSFAYFSGEALGVHTISNSAQYSWDSTRSGPPHTSSASLSRETLILRSYTENPRLSVPGSGCHSASDLPTSGYDVLWEDGQNRVDLHACTKSSLSQGRPKLKVKTNDELYQKWYSIILVA